MIERKLFTLSVLSIAISFNVNADMAAQMDSAFDSMVNTTTPKAYNSARRGVITGGEIFIRNETKRVNIANMTAPSMSAGCGGISLHGGSFSFLNADQFVQTFQAIGSNAIGYGVKLALQSSCTSCESVMTSLEKTAEFMNKLNIDTCQAATGLVDAGADLATTLNSDNKAKTAELVRGGFSDISEAMDSLNTEGKSATATMQENDPNSFKETITKNIAWGSFKQNNVASVYGDGSGATFPQLLMSITGTVIVAPKGNDPESGVKLTKRSGHKITLKDLVSDTTNSPVDIYKCDTTDKDGCLDVSIQDFKDKGMIKRIDEALLGEDGMIQSLKNDREWGSEAKQALSLKTAIGSICAQKIYSIMSTSRDSEAIASTIAVQCSTRMAIETTYAMVLNFIASVENSLINYESQKGTTNESGGFDNGPALTEMRKILSESRAKYTDEYSELIATYPSDSIILQIQALDATNGSVSTLVE